MKVVLRLAVLVLIMTFAVLIWQNYRPSPLLRVPASPIAPPNEEKPNLSSRIWTDKNGRTFEGSLVSAKNSQVVIRRLSDSAYFQISATTLAPGDQAFIQEQVRRAGNYSFVDQLPGHYTLSRKLDIKGYLVRAPAPDAAGGRRLDRVDPTYLLLLSPKLHGEDSGSIWVRVDEKTFRSHAEGDLISQEQLLDFSDKKGGFTESLPWSRSQLTIVEAQYGPNAQGINVTQKLIRLASQGGLPVEISPATFQLEPHTPATWELTVLWRTATGEVRRTLHDGALVTWP